MNCEKRMSEMEGHLQDLEREVRGLRKDVLGSVRCVNYGLPGSAKTAAYLSRCGVAWTQLEKDILKDKLETIACDLAMEFGREQMGIKYAILRTVTAAGCRLTTAEEADLSRKGKW